MSRPSSSSSGEPSGWRLVNSLLGSARRKSAGLLTGALRSVGLSRARRVRFQPNCTVLEFERELFGGGGVPEADNVSLGLSPKLFGTYSVTLADKHGKDEYAASGYLESSVKAQLLSQCAARRAAAAARRPRLPSPARTPAAARRRRTPHAARRPLPTPSSPQPTVASRRWEDEPVLEERLEVASEIERTRRPHLPAPSARPGLTPPPLARPLALRRERQESASSRRDQRQMPANTEEALEVAAKDAMAAREAARPRKARPTPGAGGEVTPTSAAPAQLSPPLPTPLPARRQPAERWKGQGGGEPRHPEARPHLAEIACRPLPVPSSSNRSSSPHPALSPPTLLPTPLGLRKRYVSIIADCRGSPS